MFTVRRFTIECVEENQLGTPTQYVGIMYDTHRTNVMIGHGLYT